MRAKRFVQALVVTATLIVGVIVVGIAATQTSWFRNWLRGYITREAHQYLNGELTIGRLGGNLFFGIELEDVGITLNGRPVISVKDIGLRYNSLEFLRKGMSVQSLRIDHPVVYLQRDGQEWSIARLLKKTDVEADRRGPGRPLRIDAIGIAAGSIVFEQPFEAAGVVIPRRVDDIDARLAFGYEPVRYSVEIAQLSFRGSNPGLVVHDLSGGVSVHDDEIDLRKVALRTSESSISLDGAIRDYLTTPVFNVQASANVLSLPELAAIVPSLSGIGVRPAIELKAEGPLDRLNATLHVRSSAGDLDGQVMADVAAPGQSVKGDVAVRHLNLAAFSGRAADKSDVNGAIKTDLHAASLSDVDSLRGTVDLVSANGSAGGYTIERIKARALVNGRHVGVDGAAGAYGAAATFKGSIDIPTAAEQAVTFNVGGDFRSVNLARLPKQLKLPAAPTNLNASYHVRGAGTARVQGDVRLADSDVPGARLARGSSGTFSMTSKPGASPVVDYQADLTASRVDLQQLGRAFGVKALDEDRYRTVVNIHAQASGHGTSPATMQAKVRGELTDSTLFAGRVPELTFDAALDHDTLQVNAAGMVADVDPGVVTGRPQLKGTVAGSVEVEATIAQLSAGLDLDRVEAHATASLAPSDLNGLHIDRVDLDASYQSQLVNLRSLDVAGPDLTMQASGTISLAPSGTSDLKVHADSSNLAALGKLVDQELTGIGAVDAAVAGNRTNLRVTGTFKGGGLAVGDNGALTVSSDYTADIPNLSAPDAIVSATTHATFVTVAGQHVNELTATTCYHESQLDVDVSAKQGQREMNAAGTVLLRPEERELRLTRLDLTEQKLHWHLAPESPATIRYGSGMTTVEHLRLESGDQAIAAEGTFGRPGQDGEPLHVNVVNLDLSNVDTLLLRPPQFTGRLDASATVSGSLDAPQARAEFAVNQGGFREFHYQAFKGTVAYDGRGVTIDSQLDQNQAASLSARGFVPATAFKDAGADSIANDGAEAAGARGDQFDLHVESTPIDLGIVQGFTTALTKVSGTAQANIHVTGPGDDPRPQGTIVVSNGAFTVDATGVPYASLNGRIELQDDRVHIATLGMVDNASSPLAVTGDIPIRRALTGDVNLQITAHDFKVLDNKMGKVRINSDLRVAGELRAPRIEGDLALSTGTINLDPILATAGDGAYSTKPADYPPAAARAPEQETSETQPAGFAGVAMNVHVTVPDDLVVKSDDLRAGSAPIGLGAVNVTLGGDLRATKAPNQRVRLAGTVDAVRGTYQFQGRQFTILRDGTIRFDGDPIDRLNPALDIRTERIIQGVQANVNIRGTLQRPRIQLTSVPALERADILSLIVFNQPVNQLGEGQQLSLNERAEQLALGSIAGQLSKSLGSLLKVSEFQIQAAPESGAAAQVTIGQQVSQNLFIRVEQGVGDVSTTNAVLEYELKNWLRLQTNLIQAAAVQQALFQAVRDSGFDLIFTFTR